MGYVQPMGYGGGIGMGGSTFVEEKRGLFGNETIIASNNGLGGSTFVEEKRGLFGSETVMQQNNGFGGLTEVI